MLKRIVSLLGICGMLLSGGLYMEMAKAQHGGYTLSNNRLQLMFKPETGLCSITDKKTAKIWDQFYGLPPEDSLAFPFDFDSDAWDSSRAVKTDNGWEIPASASAETKLTMKFPAQPIIPANYKLKISYRFKNAKDIKLIGNFHFEQYGYNFLKTIEFEIDEVSEQTTNDGWMDFELDIPLSEFPPYTNSFLVYFIVRGGTNSAGSVVLGDGGLYGGDQNSAMPKITNVKKSSGGIEFSINNIEREQAGLASLNISVSLNPRQEDEVVYTISTFGDEVYYQNINYPPSFANSDTSLHWMLPKDAGLYLPAYDLNNLTNQAYGGGEFYAHMGFNMAFFGGVNKSGDGYFAIIDDPALARVQYVVCGAPGNRSAYMPQLMQIGTKNKFRKNRTVRFRFADSGGYVGIAKEYRKVAESKGFAVPLKKKAEKIPNVLKGAGASRIDLAIDIGDLLKFFQKLKDADVKNVMVKLSGLRNNSRYIDLNDLETLGIMKEIREKYSDFYLYEYECYRDLFEKDGEFKADPAYIELALPYKLRNVNGMPINGWVDITGLAAQIICPSFGRKYLDYKMQKYPMAKFPFKARMYDILATTSLSEGECYDENHPSDRLKCMDYRLDFAKYSIEEYGLDNHTEGAAEYLIPYVNSGEGPLDIMANNGIGINSMNIPPSDRIPLWELVYHDCFGIYYHWEHGLFATNPNKNLDDLYSILYGERGMFLPYYQDNPFMDGGVMDQMIARIKRIDTVTSQVKLDKMVLHSFLSDDKMVQKTVFESGMEVIVNFSDNTYRYKKNAVVKVTESSSVSEPKNSDSSFSAPTVYTKAEADGKVIRPTSELVIMPKAQASGSFLKWVLLAAIGTAAAVAAEVLISLKIRKRRDNKNKLEEPNETEIQA